jgi:LDH2 family malate/lactate/ureidoglycolate dehydrogenase
MSDSESTPDAWRQRSEVLIDDLRALAGAALLRHGIPEDEVEACVRVCLDADLRGRSTHGIGLIPQLLREYTAAQDRRAPIRWTMTSAVSEVVDGGFHASLHVHELASNRAAVLADTQGFGMVAVSNAGVSGALGVYADRTARRGHFALVMSSSPSVVVPPGAAQPMLGTNPIAWGAPRADGEPVVLDMATSATTFNAIRRAGEGGPPLPLSSVVDDAGSPTDDPARALRDDGRPAILPFGGHRGYGLNVMIEIFVAAATGGRTGMEKATAPLGDPVDFPGLYLAWHPRLLGNPDGFEQSVGQLLQALDELGVRVPGGRAVQSKVDQERRGVVEVDVAALETLRQLSEPPPA